MITTLVFRDHTKATAVLLLMLLTFIFSKSFAQDTSLQPAIAKPDSLSGHVTPPKKKGFEAYYESAHKQYHVQHSGVTNWSSSYDFFIGYGMFTKSLKDHFQNRLSYGFDIDVSYNKWTFLFRGINEHARTRDTVSIASTKLKKNDLAVFNFISFSLGYSIYENNSIKVTPYMGIAPITIGNFDSYTNFINRTTTYAFGVNLDYKLKVRYSGYSYLGLRYAFYQPQLDKKQAELNGSIHQLTFSIGIHPIKVRKPPRS